jgi:hypothetical protein
MKSPNSSRVALVQKEFSFANQSLIPLEIKGSLVNYLNFWSSNEAEFDVYTESRLRFRVDKVKGIVYGICFVPSLEVYFALLAKAREYKMTRGNLPKKYVLFLAGVSNGNRLATHRESTFLCTFTSDGTKFDN